MGAVGGTSAVQLRTACHVVLPTCVFFRSADILIFRVADEHGECM